MASELKVNTLTGVSTAGSIAVTGEGNSTTTNLQQGLTKAWLNLDGTGTISISDSYNVGSVTDNGTGSYAATLSNAMSNSLYATGGKHNANSSFDANGRVLPSSTTSVVMYAQANGAAVDASIVTVLVSGDLA